MRIGEIAEKTGLNISNIRFYEKKGLIGPHREKESKYRNYTESDLDRLNLIILYRKMDISVEVIGDILAGNISVEDVLEQHLMNLKVKQQTLQSSIDLCQKVINDQAYDELDTGYYLEYVKEEESSGKAFKKIDDLIEDFSSFTQFDRFVGENYLGWWLFRSTWMKRVAMITWCLFFLLVPFIGLLDDLMDDNGLSPIMLIFYIVWIAFLTFSFISFRKVKKN